MNVNNKEAYITNDEGSVEFSTEITYVLCYMYIHEVL
jgi:ribonuclease PH